MIKVIKNVISTFMDDDGGVCPDPDLDRLITRWKFHQDSQFSDWVLLKWLELNIILPFCLVFWH